MTGYGKAEEMFDDKKIIVEVKTLNSKQLDIAVKLPQEMRNMELEIRNRIANALQRGKIDMVISIIGADNATNVTLNETAIASYLNQIKTITNHLGIAEPTDMSAILFKMQGIYNIPEVVVNDAFQDVIFTAVDKALAMVNDFRAHEGQILKADLLHRVDLILNYLAQVEPLEKKRHDNIREHLLKNLNDIAEKCQCDANRFEQELIFYLEKLDITEEKVRLRKHCDFFYNCIDEDYAGKKLGFVSQEMGREINTLGSKANEADIQRLVVMMKDELEKIKEQLFNIL